MIEVPANEMNEMEKKSVVMNYGFLTQVVDLLLEVRWQTDLASL